MDGNTVMAMALLGLCILPSCSPHLYHVVKAEMTWPDAQSYCREKYADLVTISSMEDMAMLSDLLRGGGDGDQYWIGLYGDLNNWKWSLGKGGHNEEGQVELDMWQPSQPNMYSGVIACGNIDSKPQWSDSSCPHGLPFICYNELSDTKYIYVSTRMNWTNAQKYCRERYTDLASVRTISEGNEIKTIAVTNAWIGLYRVAWRWSDGEIMGMTSFQKWGWRQPNTISQHCVTTTRSEWKAERCSSKYAFVCRAHPETSQVRVKVMLTNTDSSVDLEDMQDSLIEQFGQRLRDGGLSGEVSVKWVKQPDGKIFHLKESEEEEKEKEKCSL